LGCHPDCASRSDNNNEDRLLNGKTIENFYAELSVQKNTHSESDIITAMDKGRHVLLALLDLSAAFDADDSQLYVSAKPQYTDNVSDRLQRCMEAIG